MSPSEADWQTLAQLINEIAALPGGEPVAARLYDHLDAFITPLLRADEPVKRSPMQARPTIYRGVQMRSRLEARYAADLDDRGERWEYEPVAFGGRAGQYLPDFRLAPVPGGGPFYVEVRPTIALAQSALSQMLVIRESEPDAWLQVVVPDVGWWLNKPTVGTWEWQAA